MSDNYIQKSLDHAKQSETDLLKTNSKRPIQKPGEAAGNFIGNKTADKIRMVSKNSTQYNSETVTNEHDKEIAKERCISRRKT